MGWAKRLVGQVAEGDLIGRGRDQFTAFGVWQAKSHNGARVVNDPGSLNFNGLNTRDAEGAKPFYGSVFGWQTLAMDGGVGMWTLRGYGEFIEGHHPGLRKQMSELGAPDGSRTSSRRSFRSPTTSPTRRRIGA